VGGGGGVLGGFGGTTGCGAGVVAGAVGAAADFDTALTVGCVSITSTFGAVGVVGATVVTIGAIAEGFPGVDVVSGGAEIGFGICPGVVAGVDINIVDAGDESGLMSAIGMVAFAALGITTDFSPAIGAEAAGATGVLAIAGGTLGALGASKGWPFSIFSRIGRRI